MTPKMPSAATRICCMDPSKSRSRTHAFSHTAGKPVVAARHAFSVAQSAIRAAGGACSSGLAIAVAECIMVVALRRGSAEG